MIVAVTSARDVVLRPGDRARAIGWLVGDNAEQWFTQPTTSFWAPRRPPRAGGDGRVRVENADLDRMHARDEVDGWVTGLAELHGVWLGDRLRVDRQDAGNRLPPGRAVHNDPPCPPPPGGWPHVRTENHDWQMENIRFEADDLVAQGLIASTVQFRPSLDQVVLVVTTHEVAAVEARLRPQIGDRLCVIASRWTRKQIDDAQQTLHRESDRWRVQSWETGADEQAQIKFDVHLFTVTDEIADWADTQPANLITWHPALGPDSAH